MVIEVDHDSILVNVSGSLCFFFPAFGLQPRPQALEQLIQMTISAVGISVALLVYTSMEQSLSNKAEWSQKGGST